MHRQQLDVGEAQVGRYSASSSASSVRSVDRPVAATSRGAARRPSSAGVRGGSSRAGSSTRRRPTRGGARDHRGRRGRRGRSAKAIGSALSSQFAVRREDCEPVAGAVPADAGHEQLPDAGAERAHRVRRPSQPLKSPTTRTPRAWRAPTRRTTCPRRVPERRRSGGSARRAPSQSRSWRPSPIRCRSTRAERGEKRYGSSASCVAPVPSCDRREAVVRQRPGTAAAHPGQMPACRAGRARRRPVLDHADGSARGRRRAPITLPAPVVCGPRIACGSRCDPVSTAGRARVRAGRRSGTWWRLIAG